MKRELKDLRRSILIIISSKTVNPDQITEQLGIEPYYTEWKGKVRHAVTGELVYDQKTNKVRTRPCHTWVLRPSIRRDASIEKQLANLFSKLDGKKKIIKRLLKDCIAELRICVMPSRQVGVANYYYKNEILANWIDYGFQIQFTVYMPEHITIE